MTGQSDINPMANPQAYLPVLSGTTDNPVATYTTQLGRFYLIGSLAFFKFLVVTSTMTKTTLTDVLNINLPIAAANNAGDITPFAGRVENATAVANAVVGEILSSASVVRFRNYVLATNSAVTTYAVANPGIGVLTNTITFNGAGVYEYAGTGDLA
jgi:hypothetical protein